MRSLRPRQLARWGGVLALGMLPGLALGQDGQREVGPSVTTPKTNKIKESPSTYVPPKVGSEVLTPVPATATDPAPPGTRPVRVDLPASGSTATTAAPATSTAAIPGQSNVPGLAPAASLPAGVMAAEGVIVDKVKRPGKDLPDELIRFTLDPSSNWASFATPGSVSPTSSSRSAGAKPMTMVVTKRSTANLFTFARTPDGRVVANSTNPNAPDTNTSRSGLTRRSTDVTSNHLVLPTNFTVLRPGQFIAVHYRAAGSVNEVVALSIIVLPTTPVTPATPSVTRPVGAPATRTGSTTTTTPAETAPARVPRVPSTPVGPALP